jgi:Domain of unknown function (DUF1877)
MGIYCSLITVDEDQINEILGNPESLSDFYEREWEKREKEAISAGTYPYNTRPGSYALIKSAIDFFKGKSAPAVKAPEAGIGAVEAPEPTTGLDKAWHGIHFLLTGTAYEGDEPLCYLMKGGEELHDEDRDVPERILRPNQVADWANALSPISSDDLRKRFDPQAMMKANIYPGIWDRDPKVDDTLGYLLEYYEHLRSFLEQAKNANKGVIISYY